MCRGDAQAPFGGVLSGRHAGFLVGMLLAIAGLIPATSQAISTNIHISKTDGQGVYLRPSPDTSQPALRLIPEGASPDYNCFTYGQNVNGVNVWFNVNWAGATGFYASYYDDSSYHSEAELTGKYGIPKCGASPPPSQSPPAPTPGPAPTITASLGGPFGCGNCYAIDVAVHDFPTGTFTYECHDNSGPGGSDTVFFSHALSIGNPNQATWPGVFCDDNGPYVAYVVINGVRSNSVDFGGTSAPSPATGIGAPSQGGSGTGGESSGGGSTGTGPGGSSGSGATGTAPGGSMFFLPMDNHLATVADTTVEYADWRGDSCKLKRSLPVPPTRLPVTLGGWSNGRLGPIYYLNAASDYQKKAVKYILLIDPGGTPQMTAGPCEQKVQPSGVLSRWLSLDPTNAKLVVIAATSTNNDDRQGLYTYYLKSLTKAQRKNQVLVCTEGNTSHRKAFDRYASPGGPQTAFLKSQKFKCPYGVDTVPPGG